MVIRTLLMHCAWPNAAPQKKNYVIIDGMEELLLGLRSAGYDMHIMSNYPMWYKLVEERCQLSRFLPWTFVSCDGPMQVRAGSGTHMMGRKRVVAVRVMMGVRSLASCNPSEAAASSIILMLDVTLCRVFANPILRASSARRTTSALHLAIWYSLTTGHLTWRRYKPRCPPPPTHQTCQGGRGDKLHSTGLPNRCVSVY